MQSGIVVHNTDQKDTDQKEENAMNNNPNCGSCCKTKENPMKPILFSLLTGSLLLGVAMAGETGPSTGAVAKDAPFGHPDFYPSHDRPLGWRGDGSGAWPGATLTLSTAKDASNLVWCAPMPGPSFSQPLVIGEKVITQADPNWLVCVNAHDGTILWQTEIDHTLAMDPEMREKARKEKAYIAELRREFGRYWQGVKILVQDLKKAGIDPDHIYRNRIDKGAKIGVKGGCYWRIGEPDADDLMKASHKKVLDDPRLRAAYETLEKQSRELGFKEVVGYGSGLGLGGYGRQGDPQHPVGKRVIEACRAYDLMAADQWGEPYTSMTFATPVTDGEAIYVTSINNAVASVDLNGTIRWIVWDRNAERERASISLGCTGTRFICSPALIRGRLIVNQNGEIRAFDPATGQKLWGGSHIGIRFGGQYPWRHYPEAPMLSSTALKLPDGGELVVIWDGGPGLWRWEDGHLLLGKGKIMQAAESATLQKLIDDIVLGWTSKSGYGSDSMWAKRLVARSRDTVDLQLLWEIKKETKKNWVDWRCNAPVYLPGGKVHGAWGLLDTYRLDDDELAGDRLTFPSCRRDTRWHILVGDQIVNDTGDRGLAIAPPDGRTVPVGIPDPCIDRRVAEDEAWRLDWGWQVNCQSGVPLGTPFGERIVEHGLLSAQANRVFRRTRSYLWCLGDPNQAFPAPKDCPPAARIPKVAP
jgi:hypothetical protein